MTTSPVMSVTDDLIAELEASASAGRTYGFDWLSSFQVSVLLAERAELKRDAERYRWLRDQVGVIDVCREYAIWMLPDECKMSDLDRGETDAAIDAAMQEPTP